MPRPQPIERCCVVPYKHAKTVTFQCGHQGPSEFGWNLYGETIWASEEATEDYALCGACLLKYIISTSIRCARCGFIILKDDHVLLLDPAASTMQEWTTATEVAEGKKVIGCMRTHCCPPDRIEDAVWDGEKVVPISAENPGIPYSRSALRPKV